GRRFRLPPRPLAGEGWGEGTPRLKPLPPRGVFVCPSPCMAGDAGRRHGWRRLEERGRLGGGNDRPRQKAPHPNPPLRAGEGGGRRGIHYNLPMNLPELPPDPASFPSEGSAFMLTGPAGALECISD